jgi:chemotaxis signal transduction protein
VDSVSSATSETDRLLAFQIGDSLFALPISGVVEVAELDSDCAAIPTIPSDIGGVMNFHGDALPVVRSNALLGVVPAAPKSPAQIVVVTDRPTEHARLGLPVDEIIGLVDTARVVDRGSGTDPVAERRAINGRLANILDPARLVAKAAEVISTTRARA